MPQTVTLQRGEISMTHNTTSLLFTSTSSGTATRVIPGYLSFQSDYSSTYGHCTFGILRNGASSPDFVVFAATTGTQTRQLHFTPHNTATGWHGQGASSVETSIVFGNFTSTIGMTRNVPAYLASGTPTLAWYHKNLMIGPSDAFYCNWFDNGGSSNPAVVTYCFTLITES
jgi:hypothetical protein